MKELLSKERFSWKVRFVYGVAVWLAKSNLNLTGEPLMLYLGIDQHSKQLTVCGRNESGKVVLRRQVSTEPARVRSFFDEVRAAAAEQGGFVVALEVCGFNDWLIALLKEYGCRQIVLIHPDQRAKRKTDRRDANALSELLWLNRERLAAGGRLQGMRQIVLPTPEDQEARELTSLRQRLAQQRTKTINKIQGLLRRHNLMWECPTKGFQTRKVEKWLQGMLDKARAELTSADHVALRALVRQWRLWEDQLLDLEGVLLELAERSPQVELLRTMPGVSHYSGLTLACRIGSIERFPRPRSLANYFGLTPGCRNSGLTTDRLGSITKDGSRIARFILGQLVLHVLKQDATMRSWYARIKHRRGSKIARVAVMRRLTTIIWHMLKHQEPYRLGGVARSAPGGKARAKQRRQAPVQQATCAVEIDERTGP
jgi:transposase